MKKTGKLLTSFNYLWKHMHIIDICMTIVCLLKMELFPFLSKTLYIRSFKQ